MTATVDGTSATQSILIHNASNSVIFDAEGIKFGHGLVPSNPETVSYTLALTDIGLSIDFTGAAGQTITIPANASVAFPVGSCVTVTNNSANTLSIAIATDTLRHAGTANTGTRTLAQYGVATARKVASTTWIIGGSGLT
jgi:hypothetical protein